jgi:hypothetical protein
VSECKLVVIRNLAILDFQVRTIAVQKAEAMLTNKLSDLRRTHLGNGAWQTGGSTTELVSF